MLNTLQHLDDRLFTSTTLVRSKFLAAAGAGLFGISARLLWPASAYATHNPTPPGCEGFRECDCCNGSSCCLMSCKYPEGHNDGCPNLGQCWNVCVGNLMYRCCDYHFGPEPPPGFEPDHCMCRGFVSSCPPP